MRLAAVLAAAAVLAGACRNEGLTLISEADLPRDVYGSPAPASAQAPEIPETGTLYLVRRDRLWAADQESLQSGVADSFAEALVLALITASPPGNPPRVTNEIPANTRLNGVRIVGVVATVDLSSEFEGAAPTEIQRMRIAQVVYTLTQEGTGVNAVRISIDGVPQPLNDLDVAADRGDYPRVAPLNEGQR